MVSGFCDCSLQNIFLALLYIRYFLCCFSHNVLVDLDYYVDIYFIHYIYIFILSYIYTFHTFYTCHSKMERVNDN